MMGTRRSVWRALAALPILAAFGRRARAQEQPGMEMMTVFLRHDETQTVDQINQHLKQTGWFDSFPPSEAEVVSWYVMMGIGQVVTLRFPAERLRDINRLIEGKAWGGYRTEFYPTYDYRALYATLQAKMR